MKGISMPNYTIDKGTLAENMATAAIEYSFVLVEDVYKRQIINKVKIVNIADAQVEGTIFIIWNVFVIAKYYLQSLIHI